MSATALNTILLAAAFIGIVWWWKKGFSLPALSNPLTGGAANTAIQSVISVQTFIVMAVFAAFEFTLWKTHWLPGLFEGAGLLHIPYYGTLIFLTNLVSEKATGDRKTALMRTMFVIFTISGIGHLTSDNRLDRLAAWWNTPSAPVQTARTQTARKVPHCSGNGETKVVGSEWVAINPGFRCAVVFNTTDGIALLGEPNNFVEDAPGRQVGNVMRDKGIRVIFAKAKYGQARVNYMLCPHGTTSPTRWSCS